MIEEAKMLADSRGPSVEDLHKTPVREMEPMMEVREPVRETERSRSRRSEESVVSVIEFPPAVTGVVEDEEPMPMSRRGVPVKRSPIQQQPTFLASPPPEEQLPPPPLEEMEPPPLAPSRGSNKSTPQPAAGGRGRVVNREPSVGSDRYEEIIVETRRRSQSRSRMGSRTSSVVDFRNSAASLGKLDLDRVKNVAALDLDTRNDATRIVAAKLAETESPVVQRRPVIEPAKPRSPEVRPAPPATAIKPQIMAMDANGNATAPSLPTVPQTPVVQRPARPVTPDPLVKLFPQNIPDWFMITYTYSVVLIFILLIANVTPDGKLYIHFTAFWSLIIYFVLEDEQVLIFN